MIDKITIKLTYGWCPSLHRDEDGYDGWTADIVENPGTPPVGHGKTKEEAIACLFLRLMRSRDYGDRFRNVSSIEIVEEEEEETEIKGFLNASDNLSPKASDAIQQIIKAGYERLKKM
ncbi:MAG: type II toxin-antitoxin system HicB family antitoxin [Leadbetterella sp.]